MFETRQSLPRARGRSLLALSTLALLALCCLPALAHGAASAGYEYTDAPSTATGGGSSPSKSNLQGGSSSTSGIGSPAGDGSGNGSKGAKSSGGGSSSQSGAGQKDGTGSQGSQGKGGDTATTGGKPVGSEPGSDGGSSPLVPILIAILVLAGASVGYVVIKRRRAGGDSADSSGSSVSPEAS